jgi:hypothetical protein
MLGGVFDRDRILDWVGAIRRVRHAYRAAHGRSCNLLRPRRFTEKIQWRKLFDLDPRFSILSDKLAVRDFIAERIGGEQLTPLLWAGDDPDAIPLETLEPPYLVKSTHASGHVLRVTSRDKLDIEAARKEFRTWLATDFGGSLDEPGYGFVPRRLIVERMVARPDGSFPIDRKLWVFGGRVKVVQTLFSDGSRNRHAAFHDRDWRRIPWFLLSPPDPGPFPAPARLDDLLAIAERLGTGFEFVRVDCYDGDDRIWVGEITLYVYSGHVPFTPDEADYVLGSYWHIRRRLWRMLAALLWGRWEIPRTQSQP